MKDSTKGLAAISIMMLFSTVFEETWMRVLWVISWGVVVCLVNENEKEEMKKVKK